MPLHFEISELKREVEALLGIAAEFLAPGSRAALLQLKNDLDGIAKANARSIRWSISESTPVVTALSYGEYMSGDEGGLAIFAEISFVWEVSPIRASGDTRPAKSVSLVGIASTKIRILRGDPLDRDNAEEVAMWRMEIADDEAPGTHFHVQVLGGESDPPFPKALDIPRLPGMILSPLACVEFVVAELFQDRWQRNAVKASGPMNQWRSIQERRIKRQLEWHVAEIASSSGSPWGAIKSAKPLETLFL
jgi:hypothetical protein